MSRTFHLLLLLILGVAVLASSTACAYHKSRMPVAGKVVAERKTPLHETRHGHVKGSHSENGATWVGSRADRSFDELGDAHRGEVIALDRYNGTLLINLGTDHGVSTSSVYVARNPQTYEFAGELHIQRVRSTSAVGRISHQTDRGISVGDIVEPQPKVSEQPDKEPPAEGLEAEPEVQDEEPAQGDVVADEPRADKEQEGEAGEDKEAEPTLERPSRTLTKQNVIDMATAGISESNIRLLVERSWVDFDLDSDTVIELKRVGLSDELLETLILRIDEQERRYQ